MAASYARESQIALIDGLQPGHLAIHSPLKLPARDAQYVIGMSAKVK